MTVTLNHEHELFVISCGDGISYLGFEICRKRSNALAAELGQPLFNGEFASLAAYEYYQRLRDMARDKHLATGWCSKTGLHPLLIGLEGKRVEVVDRDTGERRRFRVGKSTGWIPRHLELANARSSGGPSVSDNFDSVREVRTRKILMETESKPNNSRKVKL